MSAHFHVGSRMLDLGAERPQIEVLEAGSGPDLLFWHSAGGVAAWEGALTLLSRAFRIHAPLLPGFGQSEGLEYIDDQWDLFFTGFDVLEALDLERPFVLGESMGGWLAAEMAAMRPKEIGKLALIAPIGLWRDDAPIVDIFGHMTHELVPYLFHDTNHPAAQQMLGVSALINERDDRSEEQIEFLIAMARGFKTAAKFLFPIPEHGLERRLRSITTPTLLLWGAQDRLVPPSYGRIFAEKMPNAELRLIQDAGHAVALEQPDAVAKALIEWFR